MARPVLLKSKIVPLTRDSLNPFRAVCGNGDARVLCSRGAEPLVHSCLCRSLRARIHLRVSARGMALRTGGGGLVSGRDTALGGHGALKVKCPNTRHLFSANFFQHPGIDVATADDGNVEFCFWQLIAAEQEAGDGHGSAGLSHGGRI
jgi:hypothetical protein